MTTYYAVCNVNGPISHLLAATDLEAALAECEAADMRQWIDDADCDAEDDLDIVQADSMAESEFGAAMEAAGCSCVADLSPCHNYHAGRTAHVQNGWMLWACEG